MKRNIVTIFHLKDGETKVIKDLDTAQTYANKYPHKINRVYEVTHTVGGSPN